MSSVDYRFFQSRACGRGKTIFNTDALLEQGKHLHGQLPGNRQIQGPLSLQGVQSPGEEHTGWGEGEGSGAFEVKIDKAVWFGEDRGWVECHLPAAGFVRE